MPPLPTDLLDVPSSSAQPDSTTPNLTPEQAIQREKKVVCIQFSCLQIMTGTQPTNSKLKKSLQSSLSDLQSQAALLEAQIAETTAKLKYVCVRIRPGYLWLTG